MKAALEIFRACADLTRLRVLVLLSERELCVCELVAVLSMPQGKISRHLAVLRRSGLVDARRQGTWIYYSLRRPATPLGRRLRAYLETEGRDTDAARADLARLAQLADCGQICAAAGRRNPSPDGGRRREATAAGVPA